MPGFGAVASHMRLLSKVRGALGDALMTGASEQAIAGKPCPWTPPCALDVLFREQARVGRHGIPKPFVLSAMRARNDLVVRLTLFGFACEWTHVVAERLSEALRHKVRWGDVAKGLFLPKPTIGALDVRTIEGLALQPAPGGVRLEFATPFDADGEDARDTPSTVIARLARRIDGLARWQDASIVPSLGELAPVWTGLEYQTEFRQAGPVSRGSRRQDRWISNATLTGSVEITGDLLPVWPLIRIGETCHAGRGAVIGLGRYGVVNSVV